VNQNLDDVYLYAESDLAVLVHADPHDTGYAGGVSIDHEGQRKLKRSSVPVLGLGCLGIPAAAYLAFAGVGPRKRSLHFLCD